MRHDQIALQLYTVRRLLAEDLPGTLHAVAAAGYRSVELAGLPAVEADELARILEEAGLSVVSSHEGMDRLRSDPMAVADRLAVLGCPRVVVPSMPPEDRRTLEGVRRFAAELGRLAEPYAERGIRLGYHNHDFEFRPFDGIRIWEVLLGELPAWVELEVDVYWVAVGGSDPVAVIRQGGDRVRMLHMKDRAPGAAPHDAPVGEGILPFADIIAAGRVAGVERYIVEQDDPADELPNIASSARYLESLAG